MNFWQELWQLIHPASPDPVEGLKDFATFADLEAWFNLHDELRMPAPNLCDDVMRESRALAETDGYFLSGCLVFNGIAYGKQVQPPGVYHIANMAIVTSTEELYYVDLAFNQLLKLTDFYKGGKY